MMILTIPPNWRADNNKLVREYKFDNFKNSFDFVSKVSFVAEEYGHHPDISFGWGYVVITITTHDEGYKITQKDLDLADLINQI
jgi:4a-hydroxytetrahydrobiopterin dehydratase